MLIGVGLRGSWFPIAREEFGQLGLGGAGQPGEKIMEVGPGIDATAFAARDDAVNYGTPPTGIGMTNEEKVLLSNGARANGVFGEIVVDLQTAVLQIGLQGSPLVDHITHGFVQGTF